MVWRLILITIISFDMTLALNDTDYACVEATVSSSPFYVSDEYKQGDKIYENLRNVKNPSVVDTFLPRGSFVKIDPELYEYSDDVTYRVPIEVLTVPSEKVEISSQGIKARRNKGIYQKRRFKNVMRGASKLKRAQKGSVGFIHKNSLRRVSDYIFVLKKEAPVYKTPGASNVKAVALAFEMKGGKYQVKRCCLRDDEENCFDRYKIQAIDKEGIYSDSFYIDPLLCGYLSDAHPIQRNIAESILPTLNMIQNEQGLEGFGIGDLELLAPSQRWSRGKPILERPTLTKFPFNVETGEGPFNTFHYKPDDKYNSDAYLMPGAQCALLSGLKAFSEICPSENPGCLVQFGNMYHHRDWKSHVSHGSGKCVDLRPLRKDKVSRYGAGLTYRSAAYSRKRTRDFINIMRKAGANVVFFNDKNIKANQRVSTDSSGIHDNHVHICFNPSSKKSKKACDEGVE